MAVPVIPNIVLLHAHDAGRINSAYGFAPPTPNLVRFAHEGVLFRRAFSTAPTCGPSRAAMFTGLYPHQVSMFGLPNRGAWRIPDMSRHLVQILNAAGFTTALAGVQHEVDHETIEQIGYARLLDRGMQPGEFYPASLDRVEEFLSESHSAPFFLSVGIDEPHRNNIARPEIGIDNKSELFSKTRFYDPGQLDARCVAPPPWLPDLPVIRRDMASFHEGVRLMDEHMGRVLEMLRHRHHKDNTLVIVTSDHGVEFPGGKKTLTDQGTGVMLMMRGPGGFQGGRVVDSLVTHLDVCPTILDVAGIAPRPWYEGKSLRSLLDDTSAALHDEVFTEQTYHGGLEALRAVRTERYKLVLRHNPIGPSQRHDGPSSRLLEEFGWFDRDLGHEQLYDLYLDPWENANRVGDPTMAQVHADLRSRLEQWMERTGDPFPTGQFPEPQPRT